MSAEKLHAAGFDIIPVIPPGAALAPTSKIAPSSLGKSPGVRLANGLWCGCNWRAMQTTAESARVWAQWGANIGVKADRTPALDIDCADEALALMIEQAALGELGAAPVRIGSPPKRLLPYRLSGEPFGRLRLHISRGDKSYLVEWLASGQQWLAAGVHPTGRTYSWSADLASAPLAEISREKAAAFLDYLKEMLSMLGYDCTRIGDGSPETRQRAGDQTGLLAPSIDELRTVVGMLPNPDTWGWDSGYIKMLHAVRAAAGPDEEDGCEIFEEWAARWEGQAVGEDPRSLWRRTRGPYSVGWSWLAEMARPYGYNDAVFATEGDAPSAEPTPAEATNRAIFLSDQWLADQVVEAAHPILRYVPANGSALVWNKGRWQPDAEMLAEDTVKLELRRIARRVEQMGASAKEIASFAKKAVAICSAVKVSQIWGLVKSDRAIAVAPESLDADIWLLNTPGGIVDLRTGKLQPPDPDQLCTRSTSVTPDAGLAMPHWTRFLAEATGGDTGLQGYLKRLAGYALTGATYEQQYSFIYGPGGNGKGKFLEVLMGVLGSYHRDSPMETFVASHSDRHPTELASLVGARLVTASETEAGKRWDEAKLKRMTGGDPITARAMREDFFTYLPQFKLVFIGNHKPEIRNLDLAMRRRTHIVPFIHQPKVIDKHLGEKLREEWPAILRWMIEGCLEWQRDGLQPPASVMAATEDYFSESDPVGQWVNECTAPGAEWVPLLTLWDSWKEWAHRREEYPGKAQRLAGQLRARHYEERKNPRTRAVEFTGLMVANRQDPIKGIA